MQVASRAVFLALALLMYSSPAQGQGSSLPLGNPAYETVRRMEIKYGLSSNLHTSLKSYYRGDMTQYAIHLDTSIQTLNRVERADLQFIFLDNNDWLVQMEEPTTLGGKRIGEGGLDERHMNSSYWENSERPFLKHFYKTPGNLYEVNTPDFLLRVNPLLNLQYGNLQNDESPYYINQRGFELRGTLDDRIHFFTRIIENQANFPRYVRQFISEYRALPGNGFYKVPYAFDLLNINQGHDFLNSQAHIAFNATPHFGLEFGYGKHFLGNGYRSMLLSDFSNNYLYLQLDWRVWKIHYQNIFAELNSESAQTVSINDVVPKKYMTAHYLSFQPNPNFEIGIFESVIFSRQNQFEFQYLNPVILYRTIEQSIGSPDNVLIGVNMKWNIKKKIQLYSQFILDELRFNELVINQDQWWGNKYGFQVGLHYPDAGGIDNLDLQAEFNTARPYTYSHFDSLSNYNHYGMPLAHPVGANFKEYILRAKYRPHPRLWLEGRFIQIDGGADIGAQNFGQDWRRSYNSRIAEYDVATGQGDPFSTQILGLDVSYQLAHAVFLELSYFYRNREGANSQVDQFISTGIRVNMDRFRVDF